MMERSKTRVQVWKVNRGQGRSCADDLATEAPLEIRLTNPRRTIAVTMRTPGADFELVAGFLYTEGVISGASDIRHMSYCMDPTGDGAQRYNIVNVDLREGVEPDRQSLERHFYISSSCGVCGKTSLEALKIRCSSIVVTPAAIAAAVFYKLPNQLSQAQGIFKATGGLHAAALFDFQGNLLSLQEDVGRHNALDKLIGAALLNGALPFDGRLIMVSGRTSFEIMQKCLVARVPIVCAVSAPSSLAVAVAKEFDMTLIGFLRQERFNVYAGKDRITGI